MAFTELEEKEIKREIERFLEAIRLPLEQREQLDFKVLIDNQSILIYEVRPNWRDKSKLQESEVAKATFVRSQKIWKIFWMRADLKWHRYPPMPQVTSLAEVFETVKEDECCCFFG